MTQRKEQSSNEYYENHSTPVWVMMLTSLLRPVCGGFHTLIRFNCAPFFASCRRHRVLTVTCIDACLCAAYLTELLMCLQVEFQFMQVAEATNWLKEFWGSLPTNFPIFCRDWNWLCAAVQTRDIWDSTVCSRSLFVFQKFIWRETFRSHDGINIGYTS
jgi:hypothetical protein